MSRKIAFPSRHYAQIVCKEAMDMLTDAGFELVGNDTGRKLSREEQKELIRGSYAIITGTEIYDADMLTACDECKVICRLGVGTDNYDLDTMSEKGIQVGIIANHNAVAEFTIAHILAAMKHLATYDAAVRRGEWARYDMLELCGRTVGIIGFGRIGRRVAALLKGFDVKILCSSLEVDRPAAERCGVEFVEIDELLRRSDVVSVHIPATEENRHMFNDATFNKMKDGAYFINTARGILVDEAALCRALESGKLSGAGIDVYETEPIDADNPLLKYDNCVLSPHCSALSYETNYNAGIICARSILNVAAGGKPLYPVR